MKSRVILIFGVSILTAMGQSMTSGSLSATGTNSGKGMRGSASFGALPPFARQTVKGAPYSGEEVSEHVQTVADGTRFTQSNMQRKVFRDSEGRVRTERPMFMGNPMANTPPDSPTVIEITDPVAGFHYVLDTQSKVAHRQTLPELPAMGPNGVMPQMAVRGGVGMATGGVIGGIIGSVPSAAPPTGRQLPPAALAQVPTLISGDGFSTGVSSTGAVPAQRMMPKNSMESLGTQTVDGVLVEGKRYLTTYPVGMMGNDREFSTTSETWTSPELNVIVLSKNTDPRSGDNIFRIANLSRTPPDPSLFMVPSGYTIVDEKGSFTINFGQ